VNKNNPIYSLELGKKFVIVNLFIFLAITPVLASDPEGTLYLPIVNKPLQNNPSPPGANNTYYISPDGDDSLSGLTEMQAWTTFNRAWLDIHPGDTLILLDGVYYQSLNPNKRNGEPGKPITIKAKNDGKAIIDGENKRLTIKLGDTWPGPIGNHFIIEGIVAQNSIDRVVRLVNTQHNILRRVSAYNANTDTNDHVISISGTNNLLEDCVAAGTGRKMIMIYQSDQNTIRRCLAYWTDWDGRDFCGTNWPNGQNIQVYHGKNNLIENSIAIGPIPQSSVSIQANSSNAVAIGNKVLGSIAINAGMNLDGSIKEWGDTRPGPTTCTGMENFNWPNRRSGFSLHGPGEIRDNLFQDILAWGNAGLGLVENLSGSYSNNQIKRATIVNNGLDNPEGPWPGKYGGIGTDVLQTSLSKFDQVENSYIEKIFIDWPGYPNGERNMTSMTGEGARLTHRYVDGELTDIPLWPWPMEERIQNELGFSVTEMITSLIFDNNGSEYGMNYDEINNFSKNENTIEFGKGIGNFNHRINGCNFYGNYLRICPK
jgi:hypothetical protein